ncbi:hypothetical protein PR202_gb27974 [Eleusine coracana subsp. coracana]|uniref:Triacylglycerol lipase n=1 Tax=Eleusine coracana subsp. coracana TaxID=191504 RepID=A0AAV5FT53_ELECO|nr:hypothetical protein PR202_gb27974 [Eleusine coracana subsp. coracana]
MAGTLCLLIFLVLFIGFNLKSGVALRDHSFSDTDDRCPPSPHPLGMCKDRVAAYGYPCEEYHVTTEDGYILSLKRIPYGLKNADNSTENVRPPVLLFHGLMVAYWNWTWDQIAAHDLPAVLQFVYDNTGGQRVHYIGHSLGTLIILASFSEHKLLHLVRSAVLLCPIAYLNRMRSKLVRLAANIFLAEVNQAVAREILSQVCTDPEIDCYDLFGAVGVVRKQGIKKYDYGNAKENMKHYNQSRPPRYNLSDIPNDVPLFLTHGGVDYLGDLPDTRHLLRTLVRRHESDNIEVLYMPDFAHGDFVMAYNAPELIYKPMVEFFKRH